MSTPLNKLCELIVDCPHSTAPDEGEGYPLIRTPNIGPGYLDLTDVHRVSKEAYDIRNARAVPQPMDLILAREAPAGNVGIIREGQWVCLGQRTVLIRPDQKKVDPWFLNYYLNAPRQRHRLLSNANGATVSHVNMPIIRNLPVDLPSMEAQQHIASILMTYDNLIENNRRQIALLEEAAQRLYKEWFVDLRFPNGKTSADTAGWTQLPLTECANVIRGRSYTSAEIDCDEGVALVNLKNLRSFGGWNDGAEKTYSGAFKEEQRVSSGDIIMGVTDMTKERRLVGHVALVPDLEREAIISMDLIKLVPVQVESLYLYAHLRFSGIAENIALLANGTNVLHLKPQILSSVQVPIPSKGLQSDFARHMAPMVDEINLCSKRIASLQEARDRLLPKLMSGEIEVEG